MRCARSSGPKGRNRANRRRTVLTTILLASPNWAILPYAAAVLAVVAGMLGLSYVLGQRHREHATGDPYESGNLPTGSARLRIPVKYYLGNRSHVGEQ